VHKQSTSRGKDRCSLGGQPKTRLEFSWTLLWLTARNLSRRCTSERYGWSTRDVPDPA
jgi:hypothetical protein